MFKNYNSRMPTPVLLRVSLAVSAPNVADPRAGKLLLLEDGASLSLPTAYVQSDEEAVVAAAKLLDALTGVKARTAPFASGWVKLTQVNFWDWTDSLEGGVRVVTVAYAVLIPEPTPVPAGGRWVTLEEVTGMENSMFLVMALTQSLRRLT